MSFVCLKMKNRIPIQLCVPLSCQILTFTLLLVLMMYIVMEGTPDPETELQLGIALIVLYMLLTVLLNLQFTKIWLAITIAAVPLTIKKANPRN